MIDKLSVKTQYKQTPSTATQDPLSYSTVSTGMFDCIVWVPSNLSKVTRLDRLDKECPINTAFNKLNF